MKICVIGANGQVGAEVCVFLSEMAGVEVIPITRTYYGSVVLRRLGLPCWYGDPTTSSELQTLAESCDLVADFSLPRGAPNELEATTAARLHALIPKLGPAAHFVFVSTMAVFHLNPNSPRFQIYGYTKRFGENLALRLGRRQHRAVSVLRLGQVHGVNQSCSKALRSIVGKGPVALPSLRSYTVFTYTIAEALVNLCQAKERPGVYTVTSVPAWSWREVHEHYCREAGVPVPEIREELPLQTRRTGIANALLRWLGEQVHAQRELLETIISKLHPETAARLRAAHYQKRAVSELGFLSSENVERPYAQWRDVPGRRMTSLTDSRVTMYTTYRRVKRRFATLVESESGQPAAH